MVVGNAYLTVSLSNKYFKGEAGSTEAGLAQIKNSAFLSVERIRFTIIAVKPNRCTLLIW